MATWISNNFDECCQEIAVCLGCSLNVARVNTNIMITCWKDWQYTLLLLTELINELWLKNPLLGAIALSIQKQVYLQILLYSAFLGAGRRPASETKWRMLPLLHKYLFDGQPRPEETEMQASAKQADKEVDRTSRVGK